MNRTETETYRTRSALRKAFSASDSEETRGGIPISIRQGQVRFQWRSRPHQPCQSQQSPRLAPCPHPPPSSPPACERQLSDNPWTRPDAASPHLILPSSSAEPQAESS